MFRLLSLLFPLAIAVLAAKPTDYSTDMVMQTTKLYVSGQKSRVEGFTAGGSIGKAAVGLSWVPGFHLV
jgi:hypothetical protein